MAYTTVYILFCGFLSVVLAETSRCHEVSTINCDTHYIPVGDERVCSSDREDCPTLCHFAQKKCKDPSLTILNTGPCSLISTGTPAMAHTTSDPADTTTSDPPMGSLVTTDDPPQNLLSTILNLSHHTASTTAPATTIAQHVHCKDIICSVFCSHADKITCPTDLDPVCGTDGNFYTNDCVFAKAKCKDNSLSIQDLTICKTGRHRRELAFV